MLASFTSIILVAFAAQATAALDAARYTGTATYYGIDTGKDSCTGKNHKASDYVVALRPELVKENCGKNISVTGVKSKKTITVQVVDTCPTCKKKYDLDLTEGAFKNFATLNDGVAEVQWNFI